MNGSLAKTGITPRSNRSLTARIVMGAVILALLALSVLAAAGCGSSAKTVDRKQLILATTTSVQDSGLLDGAILPAFNQMYPDMTVKTVAVGSGEAIAMGQRGEADVLLVHSPTDEEAFMAAGDGTLRLPVARNFFVIVGPKNDPAGVADATTAADAFKAIAAQKATFISRGDASGTNKKELKIWEAAGITPSGDWYVTAAQGMGSTLQVASEKGAYTLSDIATYASMKSTLDLTELSGAYDDLENFYSVIIVNQNKHETVNSAAAEQFAAFLVSAEGQKLIGTFGQDTVGMQLFTPDAGSLGK